MHIRGRTDLFRIFLVAPFWIFWSTLQVEEKRAVIDDWFNIGDELKNRIRILLHYSKSSRTPFLLYITLSKPSRETTKFPMDSGCSIWMNHYDIILWYHTVDASLWFSSFLIPRNNDVLFYIIGQYFSWIFAAGRPTQYRISNLSYDFKSYRTPFLLHIALFKISRRDKEVSKGFRRIQYMNGLLWYHPVDASQSFSSFLISSHNDVLFYIIGQYSSWIFATPTIPFIIFGLISALVMIHKDIRGPVVGRVCGFSRLVFSRTYTPHTYQFKKYSYDFRSPPDRGDLIKNWHILSGLVLHLSLLTTPCFKELCRPIRKSLSILKIYHLLGSVDVCRLPYSERKLSSYCQYLLTHCNSKENARTIVKLL